MILFPKVGRGYWYVTNAWERHFVVRVIVTGRGGLFKYSNKTPALFMIRWDITPDQYEEYDATRRELYRSEKRAQKVADRLNKLYEEARKRGEY